MKNDRIAFENNNKNKKYISPKFNDKSVKKLNFYIFNLQKIFIFIIKNNIIN